MNKKKGFTLIEILVVVAIIVIIASAILVAINPAKRFDQANDVRRWSDVKTIVAAVNTYALDNGVLSCDEYLTEMPADNTWRWIGTGAQTVVGYVDVRCPNKGGGTCTLDYGPGACCSTIAALDNINGGIDFGSYPDGSGGFCDTGDLVCAGINMAFEIGGVWEYADPYIFSVYGTEGFNTGPDNYFKLYTSSEARHNGVWDETAYRMTFNWSGLPVILVSNDYVKFEGLQILTPSQGTDDVTFSGIYLCRDNEKCSKGFEISHSIFRGRNVPGGIGIGSASGVTDVKIYNNIFYNYNGADAYAIKCDGECDIYNNTIYNCENGIDAHVGITIKNNLITDCIDPYTSGTYEAAYNNATDNSVLPSPDSSGNIQGINLDDVFIDRIRDNLLIKFDNTNPIKDMGLDLSNDNVFAFVSDIQRESREPGAWDIGADEAIFEDITSEDNWGVVGEGHCDLGPALVENSGYLSKLPEDPKEGDLAGVGNTGYMIKRDFNGTVWAWAPHKSKYEDKMIVVAE